MKERNKNIKSDQESAILDLNDADGVSPSPPAKIDPSANSTLLSGSFDRSDSDTQKTNPCEFGECVPYYQCANRSIITNGDGILNIRFGDDGGLSENSCPGYLETCCSLRSEEPIIPPDVKINQQCGVRNIDGVGFHITATDSEAQFGEFSWHVAILRVEQVLQHTLNVYICGGSLIDKGVVLTSAHCVDQKDPKLLRVRLGEWDTQTTDEPFPHQDRNVSDFVVHPAYYKGSLYNDIALLFLDKPADIAENVNTVCLPPHGTVFDGSRCFASGWGKDIFGKAGKYQAILKRVELPIVPRPQCQQLLRKTRLGKHFILHESFLCAGGEVGKDTCKGDGGSPLVCPIPGTTDRYYQAGIVAWGIGCADGTPGAYANVAMFRPWLDEQLGLKNVSSTAHTY